MPCRDMEIGRTCAASAIPYLRTLSSTEMPICHVTLCQRLRPGGVLRVACAGSWMPSSFQS